MMSLCFRHENILILDEIRRDVLLIHSTISGVDTSLLSDR